MKLKPETKFKEDKNIFVIYIINFVRLNLLLKFFYCFPIILKNFSSQENHIIINESILFMHIVFYKNVQILFSGLEPWVTRQRRSCVYSVHNV